MLLFATVTLLPVIWYQRENGLAAKVHITCFWSTLASIKMQLAFQTLIFFVHVFPCDICDSDQLTTYFILI